MSPAIVELALKKQRLQFKSAALRQDFGRQAVALAPIFGAADRVRDGARWLRRHPQAVVAAAVAIVVARPRTVFRWLRRGFFAWQAVGKARHWLARR